MGYRSLRQTMTSVPAWRKVKANQDVRVARDLAFKDSVRRVLGGTVIATRLDQKVTTVSVLAAIGVRTTGQKDGSLHQA
jgi:hypothetical protein